jgi:uncharacterized membrane protein
MTSYEAWLLVHILAAIVWIGGAIALNVLATRVQAAGDPVRLAALGKDIEWIGTRLFVPASLILLVAGFGLVHTGGWDWQPWIVIGLAGFAVSFVTGVAFLAPQSGRIARLIESGGPEQPEVGALLRRVFLVSRVELVVLVLVVVAMVAKPGS